MAKAKAIIADSGAGWCVYVNGEPLEGVINVDVAVEAHSETTVTVTLLAAYVDIVQDHEGSFAATLN